MLKKVVGTMMIATMLMIPSVAFGQTTEPMFDYSKVKLVTHNGVELVPLRKAAEMLGYEVMWNGMDRSVTLIYTGKMMNTSMDSMNGMTDKSTSTDSMNSSSSMTDKSMSDNMMSGIKMGYTVKITIGKKYFSVDDSPMMFTMAPIIINNHTYVVKHLIEKDLLQMSDMMMEKK